MLLLSSCKPKFFAVRQIHYPVNPSSDHFLTDAVVPPILIIAALTETILPPSDHYCIKTEAPSGDHYGTPKIAQPSDH